MEMSAQKSTSWTRVIGAVAVGAAIGTAVTIGVAYPTLKDKWDAPAPAPAPASKLACADAQPQSPKDVSASFTGTGKARVRVTDTSPIGNADADKNLKHVNTHFHLGAEHKSAGQYDKTHVTSARRLLDASGEYGFYCDDVAWVQGLTTAQKTEYNWQYCENTHVGKTYELHWVYSSGGQDGNIKDGLGGALTYQANPTVTVRAQVYHIVNDNSSAYDVSNLADSWNTATISDAVTYSGSTTGRSYNNNDSCSPLQITWQVDRMCQKINAKSFDLMCKKMKEYGMHADLEPHASRDLVSASLSSDHQIALTAIN